MGLLEDIKLAPWLIDQGWRPAQILEFTNRPRSGVSPPPSLTHSSDASYYEEHEVGTRKRDRSASDVVPNVAVAKMAGGQTLATSPSKRKKGAGGQPQTPKADQASSAASSRKALVGTSVKEMEEMYKNTDPPVFFRDMVAPQPPESVNKLLDIFVGLESNVAVVEGGLKTHIEAVLPERHQRPADFRYDETADLTDNDAKSLWGYIWKCRSKVIEYLHTHPCHADWLRINMDLLDAILEEAKSPLVMRNAESTNIYPPHLLPKRNDAFTPPKRLDLAFCIGRYGTVGSEAFANADSYRKKTGVDLRLSHVQDTDLSRCYLPGGVEVGGSDKSADEAHIQISIWLTAALARLEELAILGETDIPFPPLVGFTAIRNEWRFYIVYFASGRPSKDGIIVLGPYYAAGTSSIEGICYLRKFIKAYAKWVEDVHWPFFKTLLGNIHKKWENAPTPAGGGVTSPEELGVTTSDEVTVDIPEETAVTTPEGGNATSP